VQGELLFEDLLATIKLLMQNPWASGIDTKDQERFKNQSLKMKTSGTLLIWLTRVVLIKRM